MFYNVNYRKSKYFDHHVPFFVKVLLTFPPPVISPLLLFGINVALPEADYAYRVSNPVNIRPAHMLFYNNYIDIVFLKRYSLTRPVSPAALNFGGILLIILNF